MNLIRNFDNNNNTFIVLRIDINVSRSRKRLKKNILIS